MVEPAGEQPVGLAAQVLEFPVRLAARVPRLVERAPLGFVGGARFCNTRKPSIRGIAKDAAPHRNIHARCGGGRRGYRLQRHGQLLRSRPCGKPAVAAAIHSHAAVAPRLLHDPVDSRAHVVAIVLKGNDLGGALQFPPRVCDHADIAVCCALLGEALRIWIDRVFEQRRQRFGFTLRANQLCGENRAVVSLDLDVIFGCIALPIAFGIERGHERTQTSVRIQSQVHPDEIHCIAERDGALGAALIERLLQSVLEPGDGRLQPARDGECIPVAELRDDIPVCLCKGLCKWNVIRRLDSLRMRIDVIEHRLADRPAGIRGPAPVAQ